MKFATFLVTLLANLIIGIILFFFLIIALNGFSESQATTGLIVFVVWEIIFSIIAAVFGVLAGKFFIDRKTFSSFVSGLMACLFFILIGAVFSFIGLIASVGLVSALR